jgi:putative solute:sodium symporter small subunit
MTPLPPRLRAYWRRNVSLTALLLGVWFTVTFVAGFYARELAAIRFFHWPLSFYVAAQGALIIYVCIVWIYARRMRALDIEFDVHESEGE